MSPFKLNIDNSKILNSIQKSLRVNPIGILRNNILDLIKKLKYYINIYLEQFITNPDEIFLYNQQLISFNNIEKLIKQYPRKEDLNISYYDYNTIDDLISFKRKVNDWCINVGFYSLYNQINIDLNNKYVFHILDKTTYNTNFTFQYNNTYNQISILDTDTTNDIISKLYNRLLTGDKIDSMIFLDYEIQYKSLPFRIFYQNIGEKLTILKVMLKVLSNWSKNGI
jgi:hypothetical protein